MQLPEKPLEGQVALITGASRGIGAATAKALAARGAQVVLVARTVGGLEAVDDAIQAMGGKATLVPMDLAKHEMIDALAASIYERWGRLDMLVGNAAQLGSLTPVAHADPKSWAQLLDVNLTANYRLIRAMDPLLRQAPNPRAVFVTAAEAHESKPYWGPYAASKAALEQLVHSYQHEVSEHGLAVHLFDPGHVKTALRAQAFPSEDASALPTPEMAAEQMMQLLLMQPTAPQPHSASA